MAGRILAVAATLALALGVLSSAATATRLALDSSTLRLVWFELRFEGSGGFFGASCQVTLEGSLHSRTISKVGSSLIGFVTRAAINEAACTGGRARVLAATLPWHLRYASFGGTLPDISRFTVTPVGISLLVEAFGFASCLYTASPPLTFSREVGGKLVTASFGGTGIESNSIGCPRLLLAGFTSEVTVLGGTRLITMTLVA
jgi:hypothetical protein